MTCLPVLPIWLPAFPARGRCLRGCARRRRRRPNNRRAAGDAGDQFLNDDGLAQPGPAEQSGLAAAEERRQQIDHLDAGLEHFGLGRQIDKFRRLAMDRPALGRAHGPAVVDRLAQQD
jgi:hypothetical protein